MLQSHISYDLAFYIKMSYRYLHVYKLALSKNLNKIIKTDKKSLTSTLFFAIINMYDFFTIIFTGGELLTSS